MLEVNGKQIATNTEGYLEQQSDWDESVAAAIAQTEGIELQAEHWEVIHFLQTFYQDYNHTPAMRALVKALKMKFGPNKGNSIYLHTLFPGGPAKQASRIAGLPKPSRCI